MNQYYFEGRVLPERAQIPDHRSRAKFQHIGSGANASIEIRILLNYVAAWVDTEAEWDVLNLRNTVKYFVQLEVDGIGYIVGHSYEVEITRVICRELDVDRLFGIDVPCISESRKGVDSGARIAALRPKLVGEFGPFIHRCLRDLSTALRDPNDTGFWCYRAIESLRHHCCAEEGLDPKDKPKQWKRLREIAKCDEAATRLLEDAAKSPRHGGIQVLTNEQNAELLTTTWKIVDAYLANC